MEAQEKHEVQDSCGCGCSQDSHECQEACSSKVEKAEQEKALPRRAYVPAVDIIDSSDCVSLVVDLPGVAEGGVELNLEKNVLTLSAVPADGVIAGKKLVYAEYGVGEYRRSFSLSDEVDQENISASLKNGVLRIRLPKSAPVSRKISIAAS